MAFARGAIPSGCTFLNIEKFMTCQAKDILENSLLKKAANRNPDAFDMYIYNDFYGYAVLDLVDKTLTSVYAKIIKKEWDDVYHLLEALTVFNELESSWPMCDDRQRIALTNEVYGAMVVTLLRGLKSQYRLNPENFPSLEAFLKNVVSWCEVMGDVTFKSNYDLVCKAIGERLFKDKSEADLALERARKEEWINELDPQDRFLVREELEEAEEASDTVLEIRGPWYAGTSSGDEENTNFSLSRAWRAYKRNLAQGPKGPMRGPGTWDINKWTAAQKREFEFAGPSSEEDDQPD